MLVTLTINRVAHRSHIQDFVFSKSVSSNCAIPIEYSSQPCHVTVVVAKIYVPKLLQVFAAIKSHISCLLISLLTGPAGLLFINKQLPPTIFETLAR